MTQQNADIDSDKDDFDYKYDIFNENEKEYASPQQEDITLRKLQSLHVSSLQNGGDNSHSTRQLVTILGGIDSILTNYINIMISLAEEQYGYEANDDDLLLNKAQIHEIYHLMVEEQTAIIDYDKDDIEEEELNEFGKYMFSFYTHNTLLYKMLNNNDFGKRLMTVLYSKIVIGIQCAVNIGYPIILVAFTRFSSYNNNALFIHIEFVIYLVFTIYFLFLLSSINNYAFTLIYKKTFEFWLKMTYTVLLCISYAIYQIFYNENVSKSDVIPILSLIFQILSVLLMVMLLCCIDSLHFPSLLKFCGGLTLSALFITMSLYFTVNSFRIKSSDENNVNIALMSFIGNASRIVAIYMVHHTYLSLKNPQKCVILRYIPFIRWIDKYNLNPNIDEHQQSQETTDLTEEEQDEEEHEHEHEEEHEDEEEEKQDQLAMEYIQNEPIHIEITPMHKNQEAEDEEESMSVEIEHISDEKDHMSIKDVLSIYESDSHLTLQFSQSVRL